MQILDRRIKEISRRMVVVDESKSDDGDGVLPVVLALQRPCLILGRMPEDMWKQLAWFLAWCDAASLYAASIPVQDLMRGKWSPRWTVATECSALGLVASTNKGWQKLGWNGENPVGVKTVVVAPGTNNNAALVQQIELSRKGLRGV